MGRASSYTWGMTEGSISPISPKREQGSPFPCSRFGLISEGFGRTVLTGSRLKKSVPMLLIRTTCCDSKNQGRGVAVIKTPAARGAGTPAAEGSARNLKSRPCYLEFLYPSVRDLG